ncbi:hexokinase type 2 isoform X2 [Cimex lectularius]|uniref:hexokinase n=1 Tax=Cimex lectularius TaxID=79782 RepID=A0A8I6R8F9_CIMLE|nr:hexokinase type 2 isoform X2 [Cimex lectularius]
MSKLKRGCTLVKYLQLPVKVILKYFVRILRHLMKAFANNIVWFITILLTLTVVVRNLFLNIAKKICIRSIVDAVQRFVDGLNEGKENLVLAVRRLPCLIKSPQDINFKHWLLAVCSPIRGFFEMCSVPVRCAIKVAWSNSIYLVNTLWADYKQLTSIERRFREKLKSDLSTATDRVSSSLAVIKDKLSYIFYSTCDEMSEMSKQACASFKEFFGVFMMKVNTVKEKAVEKAGVVAIQFKDATDTIFVKIKDINDTVRLGTYYVIKEGKEGFPASRRTLIRGTLQVKDGIITNAQRAKLAIAGTRVYQHLASSVCYRMERIQNSSAFDGAVLFSTVGILGYLFYLIVDKHQRELYHRSLKIHDQIRDACKDMVLSEQTLRKCMNALHEQMLLGLNSKTRDKSSVKCHNTYVQDLPTGQESGQFLALDLGGTNFRVLLITLNGRHFDMQSKSYVIPQATMTGPGEDLFDHIASCLESFIREQRLMDKCLPLGFTFSFPLMQHGLTKGILQKWTKGFNCSGVEGEDVVKLLQIAIKKKNINVDVLAVLNDTTGTLMSCAWKNHNCKIGVILGTGTNACYVEQVENVPGFESQPGKPLVLINTEWGAFGENGELEFIRTSFDKEVDKTSINPGKQIHEKMISGMYLGELVRLYLVKFARAKAIFGGEVSDKLLEKGSFPTEFISEVESDKRGTFRNCRNVLGKLHMFNVTDQDCANVRYVCECVSRRAAHLASASIATLINKMGLHSVTVGVDGSLYRFHPYLHDLMMEKITQLLSPSIHVDMMLSEDGSGRGAALVAASSV